MTNKKKQHYVPRFYLKKFSIKDQGTHIGLYNKHSKKFIQHGSLKSQAYENYFYGENGELEEYLSQIEGHVATSMDLLIKTVKLPNRRSADYHHLWIYTFLQASRTKSSSQSITNLLNTTLKEAMKYDDTVKDYTSSIRFELENAPAQSLSTTIKGLHLTEDLRCKALLNSTDLPFITSDNPVVKYNQFLEKRKKPGGKTGLVAKGLQVFYPITPRITLVFYDSKVYKIGRNQINEVPLTNKTDIHQLNLLQYLNCESNVYFNDRLSQDKLIQIVESGNKYLREEPMTYSEFPERKNPDGTTSILSHMYEEDIDCNLQVSFIQERKKARKYQLSNWAVELRNEEWRNNGFLNRKNQV